MTNPDEAFGMRLRGILEKQDIAKQVAGALQIPTEAVTYDAHTARLTIDCRRFEGDLDEETFDRLLATGIPVWMRVDVLPRGYVEAVQAAIEVRLATPRGTLREDNGGER